MGASDRMAFAARPAPGRAARLIGARTRTGRPQAPPLPGSVVPPLEAPPARLLRPKGQGGRRRGSDDGGGFGNGINRTARSTHTTKGIVRGGGPLGCGLRGGKARWAG